MSKEDKAQQELFRVLDKVLTQLKAGEETGIIIMVDDKTTIDTILLCKDNKALLPMFHATAKVLSTLISELESLNENL